MLTWQAEFDIGVRSPKTRRLAPVGAAAREACAHQANSRTSQSVIEKLAMTRRALLAGTGRLALVASVRAGESLPKVAVAEDPSALTMALTSSPCGCCPSSASLCDGSPMGLRRAGAATSFRPMRLLRALAHLALALALIGVAVAPARAGAFQPAQATHGHMDHDADLAVGHAAHDHGTPAREHPAHQAGACQTLCCFVPSQLPPPPRGRRQSSSSTRSATWTRRSPAPVGRMPPTLEYRSPWSDQTFTASSFPGGSYAS